VNIIHHGRNIATQELDLTSKDFVTYNMNDPVECLYKYNNNNT
jgi:hypothetical protein